MCIPEIKIRVRCPLSQGLRERWLKSLTSYNHLENQGPSEQAAGIQVSQGSRLHIKFRGAFCKEKSEIRPRKICSPQAKLTKGADRGPEKERDNPHA